MTDSNARAAWQPSDYLYLLGLVGVSILAFLPLVLDRQSFYRPGLFGNDWQGGYIHLATLFNHIVSQGYFPLWASSYLAGTPLLAMLQGGYLYPATYLWAFLPFTTAYALNLVAHFALLGIVTFITFRCLGLSAPACFLASLWMTLAGPVLWISFIPVALQELVWFVLLCLAAIILLRRRSLGSWLLFAAAFGLLILAGDPESMIDAGLFVAGFVLVLILAQRIPFRQASRTLFLLAAGLALGGILTWAQNLSTLEFFSHCIRSTPLDYQAYRDTWFSGPMLLGLAALVLRRQTGEFFFGILPLLLLFLGLGNKNHRSVRAVVGVFLALGVVLAFNRSLHLTPLLHRLPMISLLSRHFKLLPYFQFFLCLGVAAGADSLLSRPRRRGLWLAVVGLGFLDLLIPERPLPYSLAVAAGYLLALFAAGPRFRPRLLLAALIFITLADLFAKLWVTPYRLDYPRFAPSFHQFFAAADRQARTVVLYPLAERLRDSNPPVPFQAGVWEGTSSFDEWLHIPSTRYIQFLSRLSPFLLNFREGKLVNHYIDTAFKHQDFVTPENRHLVDFLALRYFVTYRFRLALAENPENHFRRRVHDRIDIYENLEALPRAFLVHGVRHYPRESELLYDLAFADRFQPEAQLLLTGSGPELSPAPAAPGETVEIRDYQEQSSEYWVTLRKPGYLSTSENYFAGWRAWVDGKEVPVLRGNYTFRALALTSGTHQVVFRYAPLSFRIGLWAALTSISLLLALGVCYIFSRRKEAV